MSHDPIEADLNRYLREQETEAALAEMIEAKVADWLADPVRVREAWLDRDETERETFASFVEDAIRSTTTPLADRAGKLFAEACAQVRRKFEADAPGAVEDDISNAQEAADECAAEARRDRYNREY